MSDVQPQPGDKAVNVGDTIEVTDTFVGIVYQVDDDGWVRYHDVDDETQQHAASFKSATIHVVERADDPSRDVIGTIRGDRYAKLTEGDERGLDWWDLKRSMWTNSVVVPITMSVPAVTGAVPGTPAAQAQQAPTYQNLDRIEWNPVQDTWLAATVEGVGEYRLLIRLDDNDQRLNVDPRHVRTLTEVPDRPAPLVVQYGDPEPDSAHKYRSVAGPIIEMGVFGWRMLEFNGDATINVPWSAIPEKHFPLTEVVVEP